MWQIPFVMAVKYSAYFFEFNYSYGKKQLKFNSLIKYSWI